MNNTDISNASDVKVIINRNGSRVPAVLTGGFRYAVSCVATYVFCVCLYKILYLHMIM